MTDEAAILMAFGICIATILVGTAISNHIDRAEQVEFHTPYCSLKSSNSFHLS